MTEPVAQARSRPRLAEAFVPVGSIALLVGMLALVLASAGNTLGYDFHCYEGAAQALRDGRPIYDVAFSVNVGTCPGTYTYPPAFAAAPRPVALPGGSGRGPVVPGHGRVLPGRSGAAAGEAGRALADRDRGRARLAAAVRGQARPGGAAPLPGLRGGLAVDGSGRRRGRGDGDRGAGEGAAGAARRSGPSPRGGSARLRWPPPPLSRSRPRRRSSRASAAWGTYADLLRDLGGQLDDAAQLRAGRRRPHGRSLGPVATAIQLASAALAVAALLVAWRYASPELSLQVTIVASQLISSPLRDHYAVLLLLPTAWLVGRGRTWAVVFPLAGWIALFAATPGCRRPASRSRSSPAWRSCCGRPRSNGAQPAPLRRRHRRRRGTPGAWCYSRRVTIPSIPAGRPCCPDTPRCRPDQAL